MWQNNSQSPNWNCHQQQATFPTEILQIQRSNRAFSRYMYNVLPGETCSHLFLHCDVVWCLRMRLVGLFGWGYSLNQGVVLSPCIIQGDEIQKEANSCWEAQLLRDYGPYGLKGINESLIIALHLMRIYKKGWFFWPHMGKSLWTVSRYCSLGVTKGIKRQ